MPSAAAICALAIGVANGIELGVGEVAQIADRCRTVPRQHIKCVGEIAPAILGRILGVRHEIFQAIERKLEPGIGHGKAALARASEEVGNIGIKPHVIPAGGP